MNAAEARARLTAMVASRTTPQLIELWDLTERQITDQATPADDRAALPTVRGFIMDELEARDAAAFAAWIDTEATTRDLRTAFAAHLAGGR